MPIMKAISTSNGVGAKIAGSRFGIWASESVVMALTYQRGVSISIGKTA
jgi:hypothetical protein